MRRFLFKLGNVCSCWMVFPIACALVVIGAKCWLINNYASPTPFWDQWDAEGAELYPRYLGGTLQLSDLLAAHAEHRILITRLWSLLLLELNGYWDPIFQMVANAPLIALAAALLVAAFRRILDTVSLIVLTLFSMVIFALPLAWDNVLAGFHSAWYFVILASLAGLILLPNATAFTSRWWIATLLLCASYLCMASGAATLAAAIALCVVQLAVGRRSGLGELLAIAVLAALFVWLILDVPSPSVHAPLKAHSIEEFFWPMMRIGSWPVVLPSAPKATLLLFAAVIHAPAILLSAYVIWRRPSLDDPRWLLVALTGWHTLNAIAAAYGRAMAPTNSRYLDLYAMALVLNCACLLYLVSSTLDSPLWHKFAFGAISLWLLLVLPGAVEEAVLYSVPDLANRRATGRIQTENLRAYLMTNDISFLENKPRLHIPYPDARRLAEVASAPMIRAILPPALVGEESAAVARHRGVARFTGRAAGAFKEFMLRRGVLLMPIGIALVLLGLLLHGLRAEPIVASSARGPAPTG